MVLQSWILRILVLAFGGDVFINLNEKYSVLKKSLITFKQHERKIEKKIFS